MSSSSLKDYEGDMIASGDDDGRLRMDTYPAARISICFGAKKIRLLIFPPKKYD
jgi:hypothetical protein